MDDKFYNLDDDFIDDGDLDGIEEDESIFADSSKFLSGDPSEMGEEAKTMKYQQILDGYKVLTNEEVEAILEEEAAKEKAKDRKQQLTLP